MNPWARAGLAGRGWRFLALAVLVLAASPAIAQDITPPMPKLAPTRAAPASGEGANAVFVAPPDAGSPAEALPFAEETQPMELRSTGDGEDAAPMLSYPGGDDQPIGEGDIGPGDAIGNAPAPQDAGPPADIKPGTFTLEARLAANAPPLGVGVKWRIFGDAPGTDGRLPLLGQADGGTIYIRLEPGAYYIHAAYGRAGATRKIQVSGPTGGEVFVLNAGGMRLLAMNAGDQQLLPGDVSFDIYAPDEGGSEERYLLIPDAPPGRVIPLNAGTYHVVCKYGAANAVVRADVRIDPGKLTETTLFQKGARLTLKLVEQHGGEAIADTAWSVVTAAGENIVESVGAFPSVVLAEGDYTAIARHDGRIFQANFSVSAGLNRDIEVIAE
jgi:hypothetical protein